MLTTTGNARRRLGELLREHRIDSEMTGAQVAGKLGCSGAHISRLENGKRIVTRALIRSFAKEYDLDEQQVAALESLRQQAREAEAPWWTPYNVGNAYARLLEAESAAMGCLDYQTVLVPALLQVPKYAFSVNAMGSADLGRGQVDALTEVRMRRQARLQGDHPLRLEAIVTEAALRFVVGGPEVYKGQIRHLLDVVDRLDHVTVQVIPYAAGENGTQTGTFNVYEMPYGEKDLAFGESVSGAAAITAPLELRHLRRLFTELQNAALSPEDSRTLISSLV
ncbi:helix-turn-helix domain-containing protein [Embleya sp. NPDC127516]|uniref:helix-turn-helix domain-containing protein n=1 Tax=Embleya sp. NPDC127516 TaxID=3363990 RepID=UPI0037F79F0C